MRSLILVFFLLGALQVNAQEKKALIFCGNASLNTADHPSLRNDVSLVQTALNIQGFSMQNIIIDSLSAGKASFLASLSSVLQTLKKGDFLLLYFYQPVVVNIPRNESVLVLAEKDQEQLSLGELGNTLSAVTGKIKDPASVFCIFNSDLSSINNEALSTIFKKDAARMNSLFASRPGEPTIYTSTASLFSRAFSEAISSGSSFVSTYQDLLQQVENTMTLYTTRQRPKLYFSGSALALFNNRFTKSPVYFTVRSQPSAETVLIKAGQSLNILPGTTINFYPANQLDTAGKILNTGRVIASDELTATVKLSKPLTGAGQLWAFAGGNENVNTAIAPLTFNTGFMQSSNPEKKQYFEAIVKGIKEDPRLQRYVQFVSAGGDLQISDIGLMSKDSISCTLANPRTGRPLKDFFYSTKSKDIIYNTSGADKYSEVQEYLVSSAEWQHLSKLHNPVPGLQATITIKDAGNREIQQENNYPVVYENDEVKLVIHNPQAKKIYYAVIALRSDKSVKLLYPGLGEEPADCQLLPGQEFISETLVIPAQFGLEKLKIITSTVPVNLEELRQQNTLTRKNNHSSSFLPEYFNVQDFDYEIRSRAFAPVRSGKRIDIVPAISSGNMTIQNRSAEKVFFNVFQLTEDGEYRLLFPHKNKPAAACSVEPSMRSGFAFENALVTNTQLITVFADRPFLLTDLQSETKPLNELLVEIIRTGRLPGTPFNKLTLTQQVYMEKTTAVTRGNAIIIKLVSPRITPEKGMVQQAPGEEYTINGFALSEDNSPVKMVKINGEAVDYDRTLKFFDMILQLVPGTNKIVIEATDEKGFTESRILEVILKKDNDGAALKGTNYFLGIAIDQYKVWPPLYNARNDVDSLSKLLQEKFGFLPAHISLLTDGDATRKNIIKQLRTFLVTAKPNDNIIVYFSGHGNKDQLSDGDYYFIPTDGEADDVSSNVKSTDIIDNFRNIKAKHCLLIMDACFSGLISNAANKQQISVSNANKNPADLPSKWIITSGRATKVSDGPPGTNSPFASVMLSYLRDNQEEAKLTTSKLIDYLKDNVPKFNKQQIPFGTSIAGEGELVFRITR